jgi:hypothetical protein
MAKPMMWLAVSLFIAWAAREWQASRRLKYLAREQERCRGRPPEPISDDSYRSRLMGTVVAFVFACVLYQVSPDLLLAVSFAASVVLFVAWVLTR